MVTLSNECRSYMRDLRVKVGLSQNAAARAAGMDPAHLNGLEKHGKRLGRPFMLSLLRVYTASDAERDRALFLGGHAPVLDYQQMYEQLVAELVERATRSITTVTNDILEHAHRDADDREASDHGHVAAS